MIIKQITNKSLNKRNFFFLTKVKFLKLTNFYIIIPLSLPDIVYTPRKYDKFPGDVGSIRRALKVINPLSSPDIAHTPKKVDNVWGVCSVRRAQRVNYIKLL